MDLLAELESMATNITAADNKVSAADSERWQQLFGYTRTEAIQNIEDYRNNYSRTRVPDELWAALGPTKEAEGYDREAYEYSITLQLGKPASPNPADLSATFIVQLTGPLGSPEKMKEAAGLNKTPVLVTGRGESGEADFCQIDGSAKAKLVAWLAKHYSSFRPTIIRLAKAKKDLCSNSMAPALGFDCTLPHHRPNHIILSQDQLFPIWYFFYGTLADPAVLKHHLSLATEPSLIPATIEGGQIRTWAGKYKALVDAPGGRVSGSAFLVETRQQEDALRFYETDKYEVVRCRIATSNGVVDGLTFRFNDLARDLD